LVDRRFDWQGTCRPKTAWSDTVIYETHIRGLTVDSSARVAHPGTILGVIEKIPHLRELGITAIELMPIQEFDAGSNRLSDPALGVDRDSDELAGLFDEQDEAVKWMIRTVIEAANRSGAKVGLCGQAPSDHPEFAEFLGQCGIDSMSVSFDSFIAVKRHVAAAEAARRRARTG
jgi:signal transduction protein with GAF and PtsI domain